MKNSGYTHSCRHSPNWIFWSSVGWSAMSPGN